MTTFPGIGELGISSGPAVSGIGSPVFQVASEQPSFLNKKPSFPGMGPSTGETVLWIGGAILFTAGAFVIGRMTKG